MTPPIVRAEINAGRRDPAGEVEVYEMKLVDVGRRVVRRCRALVQHAADLCRQFLRRDRKNLLAAGRTARLRVNQLRESARRLRGKVGRLSSPETRANQAAGDRGA